MKQKEGIIHQKGYVQYSLNNLQFAESQQCSNLKFNNNQKMPLIDERSKRKLQGNRSEGQQYFNNILRNKIEYQKTNLLNVSQNSDEQPNLTVKIVYQNKIIDLKLRIQYDNSEWLLDKLIQAIKEHEVYEKNNVNFETSQIQGFKTKEKYYVIDYILTKPNQDIQFLKNQNLNLMPLMRNVTLQQAMQFKRTNITNFTILHMIGLGGFSKVFLARHNITQQLHALKVIDKQFIVSNNKEEIIMNEKEIMQNVNHPFITKLDYIFQTQNYLIFAMEFCPGGDFFTHLKQIKFLSENKARLYFIQICLAMSYLHQHKIVYRDLKPENVLLDLNGNLKIADFGLSKSLDCDERAYSFCGSSEYMSPEMIQKGGHDRCVDFYGMGALLYEMVFGFPPFYCQNTNKMFQDIIQKQLTFPSQIKISSELKSLLSDLLCKNPIQRLGSKNGILDIVNHPWCKKIKLSDVINQKLKAPIQPNPFIMYFEKFNQQQLDMIKVIQNEIPMGSDNNFKDFYFENKKQSKSSCTSSQIQIQQSNINKKVLQNINVSFKGNKFLSNVMSQTPQYNKKSFDSIKLKQNKFSKSKDMLYQQNNLQTFISNVNQSVKNETKDIFKPYGQDIKVKIQLKLNQFDSTKLKISNPQFQPINQRYQELKQQLSQINQRNIK